MLSYALFRFSPISVKFLSSHVLERVRMQTYYIELNACVPHLILCFLFSHITLTDICFCWPSALEHSLVNTAMCHAHYETHGEYCLHSHDFYWYLWPWVLIDMQDTHIVGSYCFGHIGKWLVIINYLNIVYIYLNI